MMKQVRRRLPIQYLNFAKPLLTFLIVFSLFSYQGNIIAIVIALGVAGLHYFIQ